jgi:ATP-binding cassette, subfamily B, bacterial IrtB/YbtQ
MIESMMKSYAMSRQGAVDFAKSVAASTVKDILLMLPVGVLFALAAQLLPVEAGQCLGVVSGSAHSAAFYAIFSAAILAVMLAVQFVQYNCAFLNTYRESAVRRMSLAEKLRKLPLSFFGKKDLSDLTSTIMADCALLETAFSHWYPELFGSFISTTIITASLFAVDWRMALAALWVLPVAFAIVLLSRKAQNWMGRKEMAAKMAAADGIQECIESVRDLKANNAQNSYLASLEAKIIAVESRAVKTEFFTALFVVSAQFVLKLGIATVALVGAGLLARGELSLLGYFLFLLVVSRLYDPLGVALQNLAAVIASKVNIGRMREIEEYPAQTGCLEFSPSNYDIEFKDVAFSYHLGAQDPGAVLRGVSFTARQGEVTALIGPSGSGKSTVSRLASRFWDADSGHIEVGGVQVASVDPETLLAAFSIVFQDVTLFNNTVMENIRIGRRGASDAEVLAAAKAANCDEFVLCLPKGYQTWIGENGSILSGGERQRISIARALLKDAPIILLDEATASLDTENETKIQGAISRLVKGKTVLIIAHRMRTIAGADKIVVLKEGKIAEQGSPAELLAKDGLYARMKRLQSESAATPSSEEAETAGDSAWLR